MGVNLAVQNFPCHSRYQMHVAIKCMWLMAATSHPCFATVWPESSALYSSCRVGGCAESSLRSIAVQCEG